MKDTVCLKRRKEKKNEKFNSAKELVFKESFAKNRAHTSIDASEEVSRKKSIFFLIERIVGWIFLIILALNLIEVQIEYNYSLTWERHEISISEEYYYSNKISEGNFTIKGSLDGEWEAITPGKEITTNEIFDPISH